MLALLARRRPRALASLLVAVLVALALVPAGPAAAADPSGGVVTLPQRAVGVSYVDGSFASYEEWLGRPVDVLQGYLVGATWDELAADAPRKVRRFRGAPQRLVLSLPMRGSLVAGANGAYDAQIRALAEGLVAGGRGDTIIRPGWEMNGPWFSWSAIGQAEAYTGFFRRIVSVMRSVPGAQFVFDWCLSGSRPVDEAMYPGDDYVDIIGYDLYDQSFHVRYADPVARWDHDQHGPYGLEWLAEFAARHGKPVSFPEFAVSDRHVPGADPDNPYFIERAHEWILTHDVAYVAYFEHSVATEHRLSGATRFPRAAEAYRRLFGALPAGGAQAGRAAGPPPAAPSQAPLPARVPAVADVAATPSGRGLWVANADGAVRALGDAPDLGSLGGQQLTQPIVGMAATPSGGGFWLVARDGGIFSFGDAPFVGSTGAIPLNQPIVGLAATPSGQGYWLVAADGGIFSFGDARFFGSTGAVPLNQPIVGMQATPSGEGYWLVARDGGIFAFGDAPFLGSTGDVALNAPIVRMAGTASGRGYRFVAADGGIFSFGDASFHGSGAARSLPASVVGITATPTGRGYWLVTGAGRVEAFGDAEAL